MSVLAGMLSHVFPLVSRGVTIALKDLNHTWGGLHHRLSKGINTTLN